MVIVLLIVLGLLGSAGASFAYFQSEREEALVYKNAALRVDLDGGDAAENSQQLFLSPGESHSRNYLIQNSGTVPVYCRVYVSALWQEGKDGRFSDAALSATNLALAVAQWHRMEDCFYYWEQPLQPGEEIMLPLTLTLLEQDSRHVGKAVKLKVIVESVSAQGEARQKAWGVRTGAE